MAEILPRNYIFGIIIFTLFIVGGVSMLADLQAADPTFIDAEKYNQFNRTFNKVDELGSSVNNLQSNIENSETDLGFFGVLNALISSAWNTLKLMFGSFGFMNDVFMGTHEIFGVPAFIISIVFMFITVIIAFSIYSAIFQRDI